MNRTSVGNYIRINRHWGYCRCTRMKGHPSINAVCRLGFIHLVATFDNETGDNWEFLARGLIWDFEDVARVDS